MLDKKRHRTKTIRRDLAIVVLTHGGQKHKSKAMTSSSQSDRQDLHCDGAKAIALLEKLNLPRTVRFTRLRSAKCLKTKQLS